MFRYLSDFPLFVEVARRKSFTQAAQALEMPLPTLSRRIAAFEKVLGIPLFRRNRRKVELTPEGSAFFVRCEYVVAEAESTLEALIDEQNRLNGRIRLALPAPAYYTYMQGVMSAFTDKYPDIRIHADFSTRAIDLYSEPYDLEIRAGKLPDSDLIVRKLFTVIRGLYASKKLLEKYPAPASPDELFRLPYIHHTVLPDYTLELKNGNQKKSILLEPRHVTNNLGIGLEFLLAGQGVFPMGISAAHRYEASGEIVRLLPEWTAGEMDISLLRVNGKTSHRVEVFIRHLQEHFERMQESMPEREKNPV